MQRELSEQAPVQSAGSHEGAATRVLMRFHATQFETATLIAIVGMAGLVYTLRDRVSQPRLLIWAVLTVATALWRGLLSRTVRLRIATASPEQVQRYDRLVLVSTTLSSVVMGATFWLVALDSDLYVKFIVTLFSMLHLVTVLVYMTPGPSHRAITTVGNIGQGVLFWLGVASHEPPRWDMLAAYLGVSWMSLIFAREHLRLFRDSLRIRDENAALLSQLAEDKRVIGDALREAKLANDSKSRFLAAASHDLRQPLHALTMFLGTMTFHVTTEDARRLLGRIQETVRVLEEQFNSLLDLSRFDVGAVVADVKAFRLDSCVMRAIDELRPIAEAKQLDLKAIVCPAIARCDQLLIGRLLRNLLDNAVKYTTRGSVVVRVSEQGKEYLVEVTDTGPGIPADQQARIFDEYVQLANPARQRRHGVGLGLAIVKRIDQLLGLNVTLQSIVGEGSRFSFVVPAAAGDCEVQARSASFDSAAFRTSVSVWLLEDDPMALESLQGQLSAWGASVVTFSRPEDLLAELRAGAALPHWICTDDMLGASLSGLETAQILSRQFGFGRVCLITGNTEPTRLAELRASGFPVIVKPATPEAIIAVIGE